MSIGQKFLYKGEEYTVTHDGTVTGQFCQELLGEIERLRAMTDHYHSRAIRAEAEIERLLKIIERPATP